MDYIERNIDYYNRHFDEYANKKATIPCVELLQRLLKLAPGKRIMEVGFGIGIDAEWLINQGIVYTGVDPIVKFAQPLKRKYPGVKIYNLDINICQFPSESFDGIYAMASLQQFNNSHLKQLLKNFHKWLVPDGVILTSLQFGTGEEVRSDGRYFNYFHPRKLMDLYGNLFYLVDCGASPPKPYNSTNRIWLNYYLRKNNY